MTQAGRWTTFSVANDVSKYICHYSGVMFAGTYPGAGETEHHGSESGDGGVGAC